MRLEPPDARRAPEVMLPMIDVVFFLIVFFMVVSQLATPEPFPLSRPEAARADPTRGPLALYLDAEGRAGYVAPEGILTGDAAMVALSRDRALLCAGGGCFGEAGALLLHADAAAKGSALARLLTDLAARGFGTVRLVTVRE